MDFVENLMFFQTVQKLWKSVNIWQSYHRLCNVRVFNGPECVYMCISWLMQTYMIWFGRWM